MVIPEPVFLVGGHAHGSWQPRGEAGEINPQMRVFTPFPVARAAGLWRQCDSLLLGPAFLRPESGGEFSQEHLK